MTMDRNADINDRLVKPLLRLVDADPPLAGAADHPDDETLALFAAGELEGVERQQLIEHLDACPDCRAVASLLLKANADVARPQVAPAAPQVRRFGQMPRLFLAAAAVLIAVGLLWFGPRRGDGPQVAEQTAFDEAQRLLAAGDFEAAQARIEQAADAGAQSGRLTSLLAQTVRHMPAVLALVDAGRLTEFGFDIGGVQSRATLSAEQRAQLNAALAVLVPAGDSDRNVLLNRGHLLLSLNRDREAEAEFAKATERDANDPLAWLGLGLAKFVQEDYDGAAAAFEKCRQLDPHNIAARFNLALTLEEQGQNGAALAVWQELAAELLGAEDRKKVDEAIRLLQPGAGN